MRKFLLTTLTILNLFLAACDEEAPRALQAEPQDEACAPYGSIASTAPASLADPPLGASPSPSPTMTMTMTMTMTPPPTLPPTCTPAWPTYTPRPTVVYSRPPINVATAPQNLTLGPGGEHIGHAATSPGAIAVTWQRGDQSRVSIRSSFGWRAFSAPPGELGHWRTNAACAKIEAFEPGNTTAPLPCDHPQLGDLSQPSQGGQVPVQGDIKME